MGNLNPRQVYIPPDFTKNPTIISIVTSFRLVKHDDVLAIMNKKIIQDESEYSLRPLFIMDQKIKTYIYNEYLSRLQIDRYDEDLKHDWELTERLVDELKPYVTSTIFISPEIAKSTICLESDPSVSIKIEDIFNLLSYNTGLANATAEFEKHLAEAKKGE